MTLNHGRDLMAIPGPSVIPDRVLRAMNRAAPDIYGEPLVGTTASVMRDLRRLAQTSGEVAVYIGNGHAVWEASVANLFTPGDSVLVLATGRFGLGWAETARRMGIAVEVLDFGFRAPADPARLEARLRADREAAIKAVLTVQTDTASGARNDVPALRAAIDAAGHPALYGIDCIASLGCEPFEMDAWGVDLMLAACQKGLMTPPGVAVTFHGPKAEAARVPCQSPYWDWGPRIAPEAYYQYFCGTAPTHHIFGLREALDMLLNEEGLANAWTRHRTFARAIWAAVETWGGALELNIADPAQRSHAVTTIRTAPGLASRLRTWCAGTAGLTLGIGLCGPDQDPESLFRIGHMGHLNPPMVLGALATIEAGLAALGGERGGGALDAAARIVAASGEESANMRIPA
jgi:alanine-glyoxylate transaminase/serine-glyoxylate transaminase/serine-pyruvate transaminase